MNSYTYYPLTHPQKRIWYTEKLYPGTSINNLGGIVRIDGEVNQELLEKAIHLFILRNEGMQLQLVEQDGDVKQYVMPYQPESLPIYDFRGETNPHQALHDWAESMFRTSFQLIESPLFQFAKLKIDDRTNGYLVKLHHIISDGFTFRLMTDQISQFYLQLLQGEEISVQGDYSYIQYIKLEQEYLKSPRFLKNKKHWNEMFEELPDSFLMKSSHQLQGERVRFFLDEISTQALVQFTKENHISHNSFFITLMLVYLNLVTQQDELIIGTPVLNRSGVSERNTVGMFTSTMPFRTNLDRRMTFSELLRKVNSELKSCYFHQKYPFDLLMQDLAVHNKQVDNLFHVCVNTYSTKLATELNGDSVQNLEYYNGYQLYSLQLAIKEWASSGELELQYDYKIRDFTREQIDDMHCRITRLLQQFIANPEMIVGESHLLSEEEIQNVMFNFNLTKAAYPARKPIHQLFAEQVERTPDRIALRYENELVTYRELDQKANSLAKVLQVKGVKRNKLVGIMGRHSIELVTAIIAILKSGGAYLPIDPDYPVDRINMILEDSQIAILLTDQPLDSMIPFSGDIIRLDQPHTFVGGFSAPPIVNQPDDLVYLIYTSGSTGRPKGTMIHHQGLVNYIWWAKKTYIKDDEDVFALYSSLAFDLTVTSIFTPLISGNQLVIYRDDGQEFILHKILRENLATVIKLTPAHLSLLKQESYPDSILRCMIVGGEDLKSSLASAILRCFRNRIEIFNEYGPTETVVGCMIHKFNFQKDTGVSVPIGHPIDNMQVYVLDRHLQPIPAGIKGELYISGDGLALGYLNRAELTQERFINNPYQPGRRMYKTGDLAMFLPTGAIQYLGRTDYQVKIKGYRIEIGEIEYSLLALDSVDEAVVIVHEGEGDLKYLIAYVVVNHDIPDWEIRSKLTDKLPNYMVPSIFIKLDAMPLTTNGKVNRHKLPAPKKCCEMAEKDEFSLNEWEKKLLYCMEAILQIDGISLFDNFYQLGGDSIKAIQLVNKLKEMGLQLAVKDVLNYPVLQNLASRMQTLSPELADQSLCLGEVGQTPMTTWFFDRDFPQAYYWNQSVVLRLYQSLTQEQLDHILRELFIHHDSLRLRYDPATGRMQYTSPQEIVICSSWYDLSQDDAVNQKSSVKMIGERHKANFDLQKGPLFQAVMFNLKNNQQQLLLTAHHLVVDGVSWRILLEDIAQLIEDVQDNRKTMLPIKTHSYQKWAEVLANYTETYAVLMEEYWTGVMKHSEAYSLPIDFIHDPGTVTNSETTSITMSIEETKLLLRDSVQAFRAQVQELLLTALALALQEAGSDQVVWLEIEGHGRQMISEYVDINRTVGWFTSMYPVRLHLTDKGISEQLRLVKEQLELIPNKGFDYSVLTYLKKSVRPLCGKQLRFNYLGDVDSYLPSQIFEIADIDTGSERGCKNHLTCVIEVNVMVIRNQLSINVTYSKSHYRQESIDRFLTDYVKFLKQFIWSRETCFAIADFETVELSADDLKALFE